ncbi:MAG: hypothetical protein BGO14_10760 [Chlamydiales bacterium 38-26]|nr:MAG: hypothetical protein BGO14_10760 [Chlamydiales bacterium 38-26]
MIREGVSNIGCPFFLVKSFKTQSMVHTFSLGFKSKKISLEKSFFSPLDIYFSRISLQELKSKETSIKEF